MNGVAVPMDAFPTAKPVPATERALFWSAAWLHASYVGTASTAIGLLELIEGEGGVPPALGLACFGALLALLSWRRAIAVLERAETQTRAPAAPQAAPTSSSSPAAATATAPASTSR